MGIGLPYLGSVLPNARTATRRSGPQESGHGPCSIERQRAKFVAAS
jgi:hypothetical protein